MIPIINNTDNQIIRVYPGERICSVVLEELSSHITADEAQMHGIYKARFTDSDSTYIGSKTDKQEEMELIKKGSIEKLKKQYAI
jgi:hypothetical protein